MHDLIWQSKIILDSRIYFEDFAYIMQYPDSAKQQKQQIARVKRYIARKELKAKLEREKQ